MASIFGAMPIRHLDPTTFAYIKAMSVTPSIKRTLVIDNTILMLKRNNLFNKLSLLYFLAAHDAQAARINVTNPSQSLNVTGSPTFNLNQGYSSSGSANYLTTPNNISDFPAITQNSNHVSVWCFNNVNGSFEDVGSNTGLQFNINSYTTGLSLGFSYVIGSSSYAFSGLTKVTTSVGHSIGNRVAAGSVQIFKNGTNVSSSTSGSQVSVALPTVPLRICSSSRLHSSRKVSVVTFGGGLTASEATQLYDALNYYMSNL